jgi:hypothetical protein
VRENTGLACWPVPSHAGQCRRTPASVLPPLLVSSHVCQGSRTPANAPNALERPTVPSHASQCPRMPVSALPRQPVPSYVCQCSHLPASAIPPRQCPLTPASALARLALASVRGHCWSARALLGVRGHWQTYEGTGQRGRALMGKPGMHRHTGREYMILYCVVFKVHFC